MGCDRPLCHHDGGLTNSIQVARQDKWVLRRSECALSVRNGHEAGLFIAN